MASGSFTDRTVDIAVLCTELSRPTALDASITVVDLAPKCPALSISNFMKMFYKNGPASKFSMNNDIESLQITRQLGDGQYSSLTQAGLGFEVAETGLVAIPLADYVSFDGQSIVTNDGHKSAFNLKKSIMDAYSSNVGGVGVDVNCWAPCSLIEIGTQLNGLKYLFDICNVECSRTFYEAMQEISSNFNGDAGSNLINTRVSVVFCNQHPTVADVIVRFNFVVELLSSGSNPLIDTPLSSLYDGIDNVPVFRGGEFIGSQPLKSATKCGNAVHLDFQRGAESLNYFFNKTVQFVGQSVDGCPEKKYWKQVTPSDCLPSGFPYDTTSGDVYVLVVCDAEDTKCDKCEPMPVILPAWGKLGNANSATSVQNCTYKTMIVTNVYIDLSCGKKDLYFPKQDRGGTELNINPLYQGIDASDVFITPIGGLAFNASSDITTVSSAPLGGVCVNGGMELILTENEGVHILGGANAKAPACVGDYYVLGTEINKFLQHTTKCHPKYTDLIEVSPVQCIRFQDQNDLSILGAQPDAALKNKKNWGLKKTVNAIRKGTEEVQHAFTQEEVACHPLAVVVTDVCALPLRPPGTLDEEVIPADKIRVSVKYTGDATFSDVSAIAAHNIVTVCISHNFKTESAKYAVVLTADVENEDGGAVVTGDAITFSTVKELNVADISTNLKANYGDEAEYTPAVGDEVFATLQSLKLNNADVKLTGPLRKLFAITAEAVADETA